MITVSSAEPPVELYFALHPDGGAVAELLAAGVTLPRVLGLYPAEPATCAAKLLPLLTVPAARQLVEENLELNEVSANLYGYLLDINENLSESWAQEYDRFVDSALGNEFAERIKASWLTPPWEKSSMIDRTVENLFDCCWVLCNWAQLAACASMPEGELLAAEFINSIQLLSRYLAPLLPKAVDD